MPLPSFGKRGAQYKILASQDASFEPISLDSDREQFTTDDTIGPQTSVSWLYWFGVGVLASLNLTLWIVTLWPNEVLKRPSPWIGFQNVDYTGSYFEWAEELTFPDVLGPINNEPYPVDGNRYFSKTYGTLTKDDRRLLVTNKISTIAQFRTREIGLEICRLQLGLPVEGELAPSNVNRTKEQPHWNLEPHTFDIDVWTTPTTGVMTMSTLFRPPKDRKIATLVVVKNGTIASAEFPCNADSLHTFELTCASKTCFLDVWQDRIEYLIGLSLVQRSSLGTENNP